MSALFSSPSTPAPYVPPPQAQSPAANDAGAAAAANASSVGGINAALAGMDRRWTYGLYKNAPL